MVIIFLIASVILTVVSAYKLVKFDIKLIKLTTVFMLVVGLVGTYFSLTSPTSVLRKEIVNGETMTVVEYSLTGDSTVIYNVKATKTFTGVVVKSKHISTMRARIIRNYTDATVRLSDGREVKTKFKTSDRVKTGDTVTVTERFYPFYEMTFTK